MRREILIAAVQRVAKDIEDSGLASLLEGRASRSKSEESSNVLEVFRRYTLATSSYGEVEFQVLEAFELTLFTKSGVWGELNDAIPGAEFMAKVRSATIYAPRIANLLSQDYIEEIKSKSSENSPHLRGKTLLTVILPEAPDEFSSPDRVLFAIKSISDLYEVHRDLEGLTDDLILLACDSGSDKSFDFLGLAKLVESLKETIIFIWDRVVLHRHVQASATIDILTKSLPVLETISELEASNKLSRELAEQLRRKTLGACSKFIEAGAIIPEMEYEGNQNPRRLMKPEPKLLAAPEHSRRQDQEPHSNIPRQDNKLENTSAVSNSEIYLREQVEELKRRLDLAQESKNPSASRRKRPKPT